MIPRDFITEWRAQAPWIQDAQVEQDLVISRALVEIFSEPYLRGSLAFRGGTALYKLHLRPAARYSEDIDLVQVSAEPIGRTIDALRTVLGSWLGEPRRKQNEGRVTLVYRFVSEDIPPTTLRLKVEINSREHFTLYGLKSIPFSVSSRWFGGRAEILSFEPDELLGTKMRALHQRKKGRDLFDLDLALRQNVASPERIVQAFCEYMRRDDLPITRAMFEQTFAAKLADPQFTADITPLLTTGYAWNPHAAAARVREELIARLPGDPWRGDIRS